MQKLEQQRGTPGNHPAGRVSKLADVQDTCYGSVPHQCQLRGSTAYRSEEAASSPMKLGSKFSKSCSFPISTMMLKIYHHQEQTSQAVV